MLEEEFRVDNQNDSRENSESEIQVDNFSKTTKLLDKKLKDKKDNILKVLEKGNLKDLFERLLLSDTEDKRKCIEELLTCENDEIKIKEVILANLPDGYAYNVSTGNIVETQVNEPNTNFTGATTTDKKGETAAQDKETAAQKGVDTVQIEETAAQDKETAENRIQMVRETENRLLDYRTQLLAGHDDVKGKTEEKAKLAQQQLPQETRNQLKEKGYDDDDINNYILLRVTLNEVKSDSSFDKNAVAQFEKSVNELSTLDIILKNIDNSCNVPDTNLSSFSKENIAQTRTELFNSEVGNDSLISAKKSNMESHDYSEIFPEKIEADELIAKYGNFLEGNLKTFWQNYKNNPNEIKNKVNEIKNNPNPTDEDKRFLQIYNYMIAELDKKRKETEEQAKNMIEELCIISQIKGMYMCMGEGADFNLNKAREIESENGILTLRGHIDGVDFAIRQDTNNPEARLQTSTKLAKERKNKDDTNKGENFIVGGKDKFVDSNFILPSQDQIFALITETVSSDSSLENSNNQEEYFEKLQKNIMGKVEDKYEKTKYAQHYMKEQVKREKTIDKTISFIEKIKGSKLDAEDNNSKTQLYDFLNLMDFNVRYSTSAEKDKFYRVMDRVDRMLEQAKDNPTDGELRDHNDKFGRYLSGNAFLNTRNVLNNKMVGGESTKYVFDLFKNYKIEGDERENGELFIINFDQMLIDLNRVEVAQAENEENKKNTESLASLEFDLDKAYGGSTLSYA